MSPSDKVKSKVFQRVIRLPLLITVLVLVVVWAILFVQGVRRQNELYIEAGALALRVLEEEAFVDVRTCAIEEYEGIDLIRLNTKKGQKIILAAWLQEERKKGDESLLGRLLKERHLSFDQIPVHSCRRWPEVLKRIDTDQK